MRTVKVLNIKNQSLLADRCLVAENFFDRLKGLLGVDSLESGQGLLLSPCNDIHMWFMKISIDVVFLKVEINPGLTSKALACREEASLSSVKGAASCVYRVTSFKKDVLPWRLLPLRDGHASQTLELSIGTIDRCDVREGDILCIN